MRHTRLIIMLEASGKADYASAAAILKMAVDSGLPVEVLSSLNLQRALTELDDGARSPEDEDPMALLLARPVGWLGLPVRLTNRLAGADINTVGDLVSRTSAELLEIKQVGALSLFEIRLKLSNHRLILREDLPTRTEELGLSERVCTILMREGIHTVGDLTALTAAEVRDIHHLGDISFAEVIAALGRHDLNLKGDPAPEVDDT